VAIDFTACTMLPTKADGTPLRALSEWRDHPHAWVKLWKHHAAQPEADQINETARRMGQGWLDRYGGKISSEWFFSKALQILQEAPEVYAAADRFIEAATQLHRTTRCYWVVLGGQGDRQLAHEITSQLTNRIGAGHVVNVAGETSLRELCALLKAAAILLTNDTGPMHVAAALGTPVIVPFGSTSPELTGPTLADNSSHHIVLGEAPCAPCFRRECPVDFRCMKSIPAERVVQATNKVLAKVARRINHV